MQVDFAIIRLLADLLVTGYSTVWFIQVRFGLHCPFTLMIFCLMLLGTDEQGKRISPMSSVMLERKLAGGNMDEKEPLNTIHKMHPMEDAVVFRIDEDDPLSDNDNNEEPEENSGGGKKAAEEAVAKAGDKGRLPSQTTFAQRREDTRP